MHSSFRSPRLVRVAPLAISLALALAFFQEPRAASACSCVGPQFQMIAPEANAVVPRNARVRLEMPKGARPKWVLRAHRGAEVKVTTRSLDTGEVTQLELTPAAALAPKTRYEVVLVDENDHPPFTVVGTFTTHTSEDTQAPEMPAVKAHLEVSTRGGSGSCTIAGTWVAIDSLSARDNGQVDPSLLYAFWFDDASGTMDTTAIPRAWLAPWSGGSLNVGRHSLCDAHQVAIPSRASFVMGVAAVDVAGNVGPVRKVRVGGRK